MHLKTIAFSAILSLVPMLAVASPFGGCDHEQTASSCASGFTWDEESQACVEVVSS